MYCNVMNFLTRVSLFFWIFTLFLFIPQVAKADNCTSQSPCWITKSPMPTTRREIGVASDSNGNIYVIGGYNTFNGFLNTVEMYNPLTNTWETKNPIPVSRNDMGLALNPITGILYSAGGYNEGYFNDLYEYNSTSDTWMQKAPMQTPRAFFGLVAATNGKLYAIGGSSSSNNRAIDNVEEYDPTTNTWSIKAPLPIPLTGLGVVASNNGKLYAIGGSTNDGTVVNSVEEYDPTTNTWSIKSPMNYARSTLAVSLNSNGNIYAIGGNIQNSDIFPYFVQTNVVEEYDLITNTWITKTPLPVAEMEIGAALGNDGYVHVVGGWTPDSQAVASNYTGLISNSTNLLTSFSPANIWVGLKNSDDIGIKFDLKAEIYVNGILISSGETNSVSAGSSGFNNAKLDTINFNSFSPVDFPSGSTLTTKLYVRNACTGSGHNSGTARLWYNDSVADSQFGATIGANTNLYYLITNAGLSISVGVGPKQTVDIAAGTKCSPFKLFGTWTGTP